MISRTCAKRSMNAEAMFRGWFAWGLRSVAGVLVKRVQQRYSKFTLASGERAFWDKCKNAPGVDDTWRAHYLSRFLIGHLRGNNIGATQAKLQYLSSGYSIIVGIARNCAVCSNHDRRTFAKAVCRRFAVVSEEMEWSEGDASTDNVKTSRCEFILQYGWDWKTGETFLKKENFRPNIFFRPTHDNGEKKNHCNCFGYFQRMFSKDSWQACLFCSHTKLWFCYSKKMKETQKYPKKPKFISDTTLGSVLYGKDWMYITVKK